MRVTRVDEDRLVVSDSPLGPAVAMVLLVLLFAGIIAHVLRTGQATPRSLLPFAPMLLVVAVWPLTVRRSYFDFDRGRALLTWQRRSLLGREGGEVAFDDIQGVDVESQQGRHRSLHRVCIRLYDGSSLPLTPGFPAGRAERSEHIARAIQSLLRRHRGRIEDPALPDALALEVLSEMVRNGEGRSPNAATRAMDC